MGDRLRGAGRRLAWLTVAAICSISLLMAPMPGPTRALLIDPGVLPSYPKMYSEPFCISSLGLQTIRLEGRNFQPNVGLTIIPGGTFDGPPPTLPITTDAYGVFVGDMQVYVGSSYAIRLYAYYDSNNESSVTSVGLLGCGSDQKVVATPNCGDSADPKVQIHASGFGSSNVGGEINVQLRSPSGYVLYEDMHVPASSSFDYSFSPGSLDWGAYTVAVSQGGLYTEAYWFGYDTFAVPCPEFTVAPDCAPTAGGPPDRMSISVTGTIGWLPGTNDGYHEIQIVFDPYGEPQEFFWEANPYEGEPGFGEGGTFGPFTIQPYMRPAGVYTIQVKQQGPNQDPVVDRTMTFTVPCTTVTEPPVTEPPVTEPPVTEPPVTQPPGSATISASAECGPPELVGDLKKRYQFDVSGSGFVGYEIVTVTFDPDFVAGSNYPPESFSVTANADGTFSASIDAAYRPPGTYRVEAAQFTSGGSVTASFYFRVPCVPPASTLTIDPPCGAVSSALPAAYMVNATGAGFMPGPVDIVFDPTGLTPETATATADDAGNFTVVLVLNGRPPGQYLLAASQTTALGLLDYVDVIFPVTCVGAAMRITPTIGPRGFVPLVDGFNFPPSTQLLLHWDYGLGATQPIPVQTDETGAFVRQILIFRGDFTGLRHLTVELPGDPTAYTEIKLDYLVTPSTVSPPFSLADNPFAAPGATIVLRR